MHAIAQPDKQARRHARENFTALAEALWTKSPDHPVGRVVLVKDVDGDRRRLVIFTCPLCRRHHVASTHLGLTPYGVCHDPAFFAPVLLTWPTSAAAA